MQGPRQGAPTRQEPSRRGSIGQPGSPRIHCEHSQNQAGPKLSPTASCCCERPIAPAIASVPQRIASHKRVMGSNLVVLMRSAGRHIIAGLVYNSIMESGGFFSQEFKAAIVSAGARARLETLEAGVPVFYRDWKRNLDIMEQPDGRKFEVCFIAGAPRETNYRVIRELEGTAA